MSFSYETATPIIPNTTMRKRIYNGNFLQYLIKPVDGYVMHDTAYDSPITDPDTMEDTGVLLGYRSSEGSVGSFYDFTPIEMLDEAGNTVTAYGERQFFCKLATDVPENQIFGTETPNPEIM